MYLIDSLLRLFGLVSQWNLRARGFALLLSLPVITLAIADWRARRDA